MTDADEQAQTILGDYVRRFASYRKAAISLDISKAYLWRMVKGKKPVSDRILNMLGYHREVQIVRKEIGEE